MKEIMDYFPTSDILNKRTNYVCYALVDLEEISTRYMDLIGRFPKKLSQVNEYIMIVYIFDSNYIRALSIKIEEDLQSPKHRRVYIMTSKKQEQLPKHMFLIMKIQRFN